MTGATSRQRAAHGEMRVCGIALVVLLYAVVVVARTA